MIAPPIIPYADVVKGTLPMVPIKSTLKSTSDSAEQKSPVPEDTMSGPMLDQHHQGDSGTEKATKNKNVPVEESMYFETINEQDLPVLTELSGITSNQGVEDTSIMETVLITESRDITKISDDSEAIQFPNSSASVIATISVENKATMNPSVNIERAVESNAGLTNTSISTQLTIEEIPKVHDIDDYELSKSACNQNREASIQVETTSGLSTPERSSDPSLVEQFVAVIVSEVTNSNISEGLTHETQHSNENIHVQSILSSELATTEISSNTHLSTPERSSDPSLEERFTRNYILIDRKYPNLQASLYSTPNRPPGPLLEEI